MNPAGREPVNASTGDAGDCGDNLVNGRIVPDELLKTAAAELLKRLQEPESWPEELIHPEDESPEKPDVYTLFEALTALRQEISMQGRAFHKLEQSLSQTLTIPERVQSVEEQMLSFQEAFIQLQTTIESSASQALAAERQSGRDEGWKEAFDSFIDPLLDTHDQLYRLVERNQQRSQQRKGWFPWPMTKSDSGELLETLRLSLKKMDQRLSVFGVTPLAKVSMEFNPETMKAVEMIQSNELPGNTVVEIYRQGYQKDGRTLRFAEVKVACPSPKWIAKKDE